MQLTQTASLYFLLLLSTRRTMRWILVNLWQPEKCAPSHIHVIWSISIIWTPLLNSLFFLSQPHLHRNRTFCSMPLTLPPNLCMVPSGLNINWVVNKLFYFHIFYILFTECSFHCLLYEIWLFMRIDYYFPLLSGGCWFFHDPWVWHHSSFQYDLLTITPLTLCTVSLSLWDSRHLP